MSFSTYEPFLSVFIPVTLTHLPSALSQFSKWLCSRVFYIEEKHSLNFPENSIKFTNTIVKLLKVQCDAINGAVVDDLTNLSNALRQLQILKNNFKISVPLKEYMKVIIRLIFAVVYFTQFFVF